MGRIPHTYKIKYMKMEKTKTVSYQTLGKDERKNTFLFFRSIHDIDENVINLLDSNFLRNEYRRHKDFQ
jgi:hypothetical protein